MKRNKVLCLVLALCMMLMSTDMTVLACEPTDVQVEESAEETVSQDSIEESVDSDFDLMQEDFQNKIENELQTEATGGVKQKLDSVLASYPVGSTWNGSWGGATQCFGFARMIFSKVYGCEMPSAYKGSYRYIYSTNTNVTLVGRLEGNNVTASNVKSLFANARVGDIIQGCGGTYGQHTMILYSVTSTGITYYDCNSGGTNQIKYGTRTWSSMASRYSGYSSSYGNNGISIYRANNYDTVDYIAPSVSDTTPPTISNIRITDVSATGYTVSCDVTDNVGVKKVSFPTWTLDASSANEGQDDIAWGVGAKNGNTYTYRVNTSEHNGELFDYETRIYAYDTSDNQAFATINGATNVSAVKSLVGTKVDLGASFDAYIKSLYNTYLTAEQNSNVDMKACSGNNNQKWHFERTSDGYYVITSKVDDKALDVESAGDVNETNIQVYAPNGLDNQKWGIYDDGSGNYVFIPKYSKKNVMDSSKSGEIGSNIYIFQYHGGPNQRFVVEKFTADTDPTPAETTPPVISNVRVTDVSAAGYTVSCDVTDNVGVKSVFFPSWTLDASSANEGQDDIVWGVGTKSGNTYTYRVNTSEHNSELFDYETRIYAYDINGNKSYLFVQNVTNAEKMKNLIGTKSELGTSFDAYIKTEFETFLTAESDGNVVARLNNNTDNQKWHFERTSDGYYVITNKTNGKAIDVESMGDERTTNIQVCAPNGLDNQKWGIYDAGDGSYFFVPKYSKKNVMDSSESGVNGSNIYIFSYHGGQNQRFIISEYNEKYTITLKTSGSGTVSGSGTYDKNTGVTVIASPADGNSFKGWYNGTNLVSTDVRYKFNVNQNITLTAKFEKNTSNSNEVDSKQVEAFVSRMYTVALNREAETAGLDDWSSQLAEQKIDGAGIANGFINSAEFTNRNLGNREFLDTLYETFFNRAADAGGKAYWMQQLSNGMSRTEVLSGFVNSQEFSNLCDKYGIARGTMQPNGTSIYRPGVRNYVLRMYTKALNRDGETVGVEDWTNRINTGTMSAENVAKSFFNSQEFINRNLSNSAYVETLYQTFMDRPSDASGKQYWINKLNNGMSREQVLEGFSRSAEFSEIMSRYGL